MHYPYNIEIVPADRGWILEVMARAIELEATAFPQRFNVQIVDQPSDEAELTFFLPESAFRPLTNSIVGTYLAHKEDHPDAAALFEEVARRSDFCITSSTKYQQILEQDGAKKVFKVPLGVDTEIFTPKFRLGVVGRTYQSGRKGESLLAGLTDLPMVELRFTGAGWPHPAGYYASEDLAGFYQDIDYLLIPSLIEGGPVPLLEALAAGCPVIAPSDIGMVEDFPHVPFKRGDAQDLRRVVVELLNQKLALRESVLDCNWKNFARSHLDIFAELIEERRMMQPTTRVPRFSSTKDPVRVLLATHGTEDAAKGGPSTRVRFIVTQLQADGHHVEARHNISTASDLSDFDVVHVFNSWPPQTALASMALARHAGKRVIFSPIALDLADWPIYRQLMEAAFVTGKREVAEGIVGQLSALAPRRHYSTDNTDPPFEGLPGHFEALRRCCAAADHVVFLSHLEQRFLASIGARTDHGTIIRNGVPSVFSNKSAPELFRQHSGLESYILCVGRVEYRKNQALLAMAMRDLQIPLVIIGDVGDPGYLDHVRLLGGPNVFHYARIEDKALLASAYAGATAFVLPSWCEGAPLAALEAGLTGVPLILSDRSSEQEYFDHHADYVSPTDPEAMRAAILRAIDQQEAPAARDARVAFLREHYTDTIHVRDTLALYRKAIARDHGTVPDELVIDVSSLLHSLRMGGHLTGVPLAERNLIAEIVAMHPTSRCVAYNDVKDSFIEVPYRDLASFDPASFDRRYWFSDSALPCDVRLRFTPAPPQDYLLPNAGSSEPQNNSTSGLAFRIAKLLAQLGLPPRTISRIGRLARRLRILGPRPLPDPARADSWAVRIAKLLAQLGLPPRTISRIGRLARRLRILGPPPRPAPPAAAELDFRDVGRYLVKTSHPRRDLTIGRRSRILTLGQSWLSNEPLLDRLIELAAGNSLEAYIYDISYVSGAHYSGWNDNEDRQRRLSKLLSHCSTAFTESRITAAELSKFASTRSLRYRIVRTGLRGKDFASTQKALPSPTKFPFILYVSSFNRRKNHDFLINVWKDLIKTNAAFRQTNAHLLLVGEVQGEEKFSSPVFQRALRCFNIDIVVDVPDRLLDQYYSNCILTVYPSLQEGWGIPVQESLVNGKICISSNTVPAAIEINNSAIIKIPPNDFFGWREAINTWVTNDTMRAAFESKALGYVPPSWRSIAGSIVNRTSLED